MATQVTRKPVRALYLQPAPLFGGAERQAALTTALMPHFGVEVVPMVGPGPIVADWLRECGVRDIVETKNFPGGWKKQRGLGRLTLPWRYLDCGVQAQSEIARMADTRGIDIILASLPFAWITGTLVARRAGIPIVWRAGGTYLNLAQRASLWMVTRVQRPDLLLCNSGAVRNTFSPLVPAPTQVVFNGVDQRVFHSAAGDVRRYRPVGASHVIGCAMRLADSKRPQDFVALAARLKSEHPKARFLLAGEGSRRAQLEQMAEQMGASNLSFLGFVADMPSFYAACDLLVLPSRSEGCPNFMLESVAMGKAMVAADIAPVVELVETTEHAVLYRLGNVTELVAAVRGLLSDPERRSALAGQALSRAHQFTARASAAKIAGILERLVAEYSGKPVPSRVVPLLPGRPPRTEEKALAE
jgi:glycosyltransferase involved in cell wall biosynthesis